jgi:integrase
LLTSSNEPSAPVHPKAFDLVERQRKKGNLSNQFAGLLAAAGLRQKKNHKSTGKSRGKRRNVEPLSFHSLRRTATTLLHEGARYGSSGLSGVEHPRRLPAWLTDLALQANKAIAGCQLIEL